MAKPTALTDLISDFVSNLSSLIGAQATERAQAAILGAFDGKGAGTVKVTKLGRPRKKPPAQYCPAPGCKNKAAPVFGMLCADHKDAPKKLVKKWREDRKAKKAN